MRVFGKISFVFFFFTALEIHSQSLQSIFKPAHEIGGFYGTSYYTGDLNRGNHFKKVNRAYGVYFRYYQNSFFSLKTTLYFGKIEADDKDSNNSFQIERNLNFKSNITEIGVMAEFNFFNFKSPYIKRFGAPYFGVGLNYFTYNPYTYLDDKKYFLRDFSTEGQETSLSSKKKYSTFSFSLPLEVGFRFSILPKVHLGAFWSVRLSFSDYLDDVKDAYVDRNILKQEVNDIAARLSDRRINGKDGIASTQRGDKNSFDYYYFAGFLFSFDLWNRNKDVTCSTYKKSSSFDSKKTKRKNKSKVDKKRDKDL